ncbi:uncharacterized protein CCOS01_08477 [Colletotrichum costaricense]|uniref:Uncharacterized protein n=1 Tax=Colletotrichum costaricense TaxID=1209916 RepID=A0AAJ0E0E5_9PEZI|nr:uncharacterized protein CCOS01_08477 [Colletotrichum costaricense]KAK1526059.1 hypothetical protein CCOS01_08477 [Colletotrichum costaricense]
MPKLTPEGRKERARQLWRYYHRLKEKEPNSQHIVAVDETDPNHDYLKFLGWEEGEAEELDLATAAWPESWNQRGKLSTWLKGTLQHWSEEWRKEPRDDADSPQETDEAKVADQSKPTHEQTLRPPWTATVEPTDPDPENREDDSSDDDARPITHPHSPAARGSVGVNTDAVLRDEPLVANTSHATDGAGPNVTLPSHVRTVSEVFNSLIRRAEDEAAKKPQASKGAVPSRSTRDSRYNTATSSLAAADQNGDRRDRSPLKAQESRVSLAPQQPREPHHSAVQRNLHNSSESHTQPGRTVRALITDADQSDHLQQEPRQAILQTKEEINRWWFWYRQVYRSRRHRPRS